MLGAELSQAHFTMNPTVKHIIGGAALLAAAALAAAPVAENWENHCTKCHGDDGKGQTKAGKKAGAKNYADPKVQAEMKEPTMIKAIAEGLNVDGKEKMKAYKDELSAEEIKALVAYVRSFSPQAKN